MVKNIDKNTPTSEGKSYINHLIISMLFGSMGIDRFYLGKIWTGLLKLVTGGGLGIWQLYDVYKGIEGTTLDKQGNNLIDAPKETSFAKKLYLITALIGIILSIIFTIAFAAITAGIGAFVESSVGDQLKECFDRAETENKVECSIDIDKDDDIDLNFGFPV